MKDGIMYTVAGVSLFGAVFITRSMEGIYAKMARENPDYEFPKLIDLYVAPLITIICMIVR